MARAQGAVPGTAGAPPPPAAETQPTRSGEKAWSIDDVRLVVTAERVTGVVWSRSTTTTDNDFGHFERERTGTQLHLLAASGSTGDGEDGVTFSSIPRIAIDFVLPMHLSLGVVAGLLTTTGKEDVNIDGADQPRINFPDTTTVLLGGRVGYLLSLGETVSLWPRMGATYNSVLARGSSGTEQTIRSTQLIIDPALVITPVPHVGILIYPIMDIGLGGSITTKFSVSGLERQRTDGSFNTTSYGAAFALSAFF